MFGSAGSGEGQFESPKDVTVDPTTGNIVVADTDNERIQVFLGTIPDTTAPQILITSPVADGLVLDDALTIAGTASDEGSGVSLVEVSFDDNDFEPAIGTTSWTFNVDNLSDREYTIIARSTDGVGHTTISDTITFSVNAINDPPTIDPINDLTIDQDSVLQTIQLTGITSGPPNESYQTITITTYSKTHH